MEEFLKSIKDYYSWRKYQIIETIKKYYLRYSYRLITLFLCLIFYTIIIIIFPKIDKLIFLFFLLLFIFKHPVINTLVKFWKFLCKHRFQIILLILFGIVISIIAGHIVVVGWDNFFKEFENNEKVFNIKNIVIAIAAIGTAIFAWWKNVISNKQADAASENNKLQELQINSQGKQIELQEKQIQLQLDQRYDSIYDKAVELLIESNDLVKQKSGVHNLKDLAITSPKHTQKCIDTLCRLNKVWMPDVIAKNINFFIDKNFDWLNENVTQDVLKKLGVFNEYDSKLPERISLSQEVNKQMSYIIKFISENSEFTEKYDLSYKYLCSINVESIDATKFVFTNSYFIGADFFKPNLKNTVFRNVQFQGAKLFLALLDNSEFHSTDFRSTKISSGSFIETSFKNSDLRNSDLSSSVLNGVNIEHTDFSGSNLNYCQFKGAKFLESYFYGCDLKNSQFQGASLREVYFIGSNASDSHFNGTYLFNSGFEGSNLSFSKFDGAIFIDINLTASLFYSKVPPLVFSDGKFSGKNSMFHRSSEGFEAWMKIQDTKISPSPLVKNIFAKNMREGYLRSKGDLKNRDNASFFKIVSKVNEDIIKIRNEVANKSKYSAKMMLSYYINGSDNLFSEHEELRVKLIKYLEFVKPDWFEEFKKEKILLEYRP